MNGVKLPGWRCWKVRKPRGFNTGEIEVIRQTMLHHGYLKLQEKLKEINLVVVQNMINKNSQRPDQEHLINAITGNIVQLKQNIAKRNTSEVVKNIFAPGYASFAQDAII